MKKNFVRMLSIFLVVFGVSLSASAQIYVTVRPAAPVVVRTVQPTPQHVWIQNDWQPNGASYRHTGGRWEAPEKPEYRYHKGYWKRNGKKGHQWVRGGWSKK